MKPGLIICLLFALPLLTTQAHPGVGILEDSKGNVFYTDLKQVWKITPDGKKSVVVRNVHTHELYMDDSDNLYGEHLWYNGEQKNTWGHYVWKFSASGRFEKIIPDTEGFLENYSFVHDHLGRMFWADNSKPCQTVVRKNKDNSLTRFDIPCFENIRNLETLADGSVLVVDFQDLKKIDLQGKVSTIAPKIANKSWTKSTVDNQNSVMGVWADKKGNLYAAVTSERHVKKFGPDGKEEIVFETFFPWSPTGGMVDALGRLWVLQSSFINDVRVQRLEKNNSKSTF